MNMKLLTFATLTLLPVSFHAFPVAHTTATTPESISDTSRVYNIEEAVVVASPKETSFLMRQPISASLFGHVELKGMGTAKLSDLSMDAPNFYMPSYGSRVTSAAYVRGVGSRIGTPAVGLYVDNVPCIERSSYDFSFMDVVRVDVLRGPQSTLYGGGSMGGVIRVFTADPFVHHGTSIELGGSTRNSGRSAKAVTYLHPNQKTALSIGGFYQGDNGFYTNTATGKEADREDAGGGKVRLAFRPTSALRLDLAASYEYADEYACPYFYEGTVNSQDEVITDMPGVGQIGQNRQSRYRRSLLRTSLGIAWDAQHFTLSSMSAYHHLRDRLFMDQDFLNNDIFSLTQRQRLSSVTEEVVMKSRFNKQWQWVSGAYFRYQNEHTGCPVNFYNEGVGFLNGMFASLLPQRPPMSIAFTSPSLNFEAALETPAVGAAFYHQSTWALGAGLSLTAGLRMEYDHRSLDIHSGMNPPATFQFTMPSFQIAKEMQADAPVTGHLSKDTWQLLPKMALQYDHRHGRGNVYVAVSKGYRPGGYNLQSYSDISQVVLRRNMMTAVKDYSIATINALPLPDAAKQGAIAGMTNAIDAHMPEVPSLSSLFYKAEEAWNYEMGGHLKFADNVLQVDYTVFCVETKNRQLARFAESGMGRVTVNAGRSRSIGFEIAGRSSLLNNRLQLSVAYGYTHAELTDHYLGEQNGVTIDYSGNQVPFAPTHTLSTDVLFRQPLQHSFLKAFHVGGHVNAAGKIYWDEANTFSQPFYAILNLRAGLEMAHQLSVELRANNLTATRYAVFSFDSMSHRFCQYGDPRHFECSVNWNF